MELFKTALPNQCASTFNELLHCTVGEKNIISLYDDFCCGTSPDVYNRGLYKSDGLHPNGLGKELLSALIRVCIYRDICPPPCMTRQRDDEKPEEDGFEAVRAFRPLVGGTGLALNYGIVRRDLQLECNAQIAPAIDDQQAFPPLIEREEVAPLPISCSGYAEMLKQPAPLPTPSLVLASLPLRNSTERSFQQPCSSKKREIC